MKKCPQCSTVYGDEIDFCLNDGTALTEDSFSLPSTASSDEPDTIIRHNPIVVDIPQEIEPTHPNPYAVPTASYSVPPENIVIVPANTAPNTRNYALFLVLGLLIGGGLVLGTLLVSRSLYQGENTNTVKANVNTAQPVQPVKTAEKPSSSPWLQNQNENVSAESPTPQTNKHDVSNDDFADIANGRVIATNARVRLAPNKDAPIVDTLPMNDRLDIIQRANPNSPWYQVECEHGVAGWMHGDTIEFTR